MFWADETIEEILKRKDKKYLITDYKTPSGKIHVGALRGVIIHDVIFRELLEKDQKAEYWYGFDDFDPVDALSEDLKKEFEKYMGVPLCNVPSPKPGYKNFAHYFADDFVRIFESLGVKPKIIWGSELYKKGTYNKAIEVVLNNAQKIRQIYKDVSGGEKPDDWYPLHVACPKCGKIGTSKVYDWDEKEVSFICEENLVEWARGCGFKGKISPFDGNSKMPYKVETAAKWFAFGTSVELAGKDHFTKGGTFNIASEIAKQIFKISPAYGTGYEWFLIHGKKMSTSKGVGASAKEMASTMPAEILRFLMVRTRPSKTIDFDPRGIAILTIFDEYDKAALAYLEDKKSDLGRAFRFSQISDKFEASKYLMRFSKVAFMVQMPNVDIFAKAKEEKGEKLDEAEKKGLEKRIKYAKKWLVKYAPEHFKFEVKKTMPLEGKKLMGEQKEFLSKVLTLIQSQEWKGGDLHQEIHKLRKKSGLDPREAFAAIYLIFIGKDSGPQAGWFLASLDRDFVIARLEEAI